MSPQTIAGSRFVVAFVDRVKTWEKTLNVVSECLEVWFTVQRKWAYLEGIFIGAEVRTLHDSFLASGARPLTVPRVPLPHVAC